MLCVKNAASSFRKSQHLCDETANDFFPTFFISTGLQKQLGSEIEKYASKSQWLMSWWHGVELERVHVLCAHNMLFSCTLLKIPTNSLTCDYVLELCNNNANNKAALVYIIVQLFYIQYTVLCSVLFLLYLIFPKQNCTDKGSKSFYKDYNQVDGCNSQPHPVQTSLHTEHRSPNG